MSKAMEIVGLTPERLETVLSTFPDEADRVTARRLVGLFTAAGLPVKLKLYHQACMAGTYRILCFIRKSAESVIINNRGMGRDGVSFQVRIDNRSTLERLETFCEWTREQLRSAADCGGCSTKCEDKKYTFVYQGTAYTKCRFLCNNFTFANLTPDGRKDLLTIVAAELGGKPPRA